MEIFEGAIMEVGSGGVQCLQEGQGVGGQGGGWGDEGGGEYI